MILTEILEKNNREFLNKTALVMRMGYRTVFLTYRDVYDLSLKIACFLENKGLQKGDKVLLLAPNSPYWICVWWGCLLKGYVVIPLNVQSTGEMIRKIAEQTGSKIIFKYLHYKQELPKNLASYDIEFLKELLSEIETGDFKKSEISESDIVQILYTSGTTGDPKGVVLTHQNMYSNLEALNSIIPISSNDRFLSILPLSHIYEQMTGFLLPFSNASQIVYAHSPAVIRDLLKEFQITKMAAVPEFLKIVMGKIEAKAEEEGKKKLLEKMMNLSLKIGSKTFSRLLFHSIHKKFGGKLKTVSTGGAPLNSILENKWNALGIDLLQGYGLTETAPIVSCNTYKDRRPGSVGKILPGVEVKFTAGGEILVRGPNVFQGYFNNEQKTKEVFTDDNWFQTGDIGELDGEGFLYLKGRKKYMIKGPGAQNVYPEDIEFELNKISGVRDSCVVGLEKSGGQVEVHAVMLGEIKDPEKTIEQANNNLASYQRVNGWSVWPEEDFPRSATRKVKKEEVIKWLRSKSEDLPSEALAKDRTPLMHLLAEITGNAVSEINTQTRLVSELNLDSLLRIELVSRIEEKFGITVEEATINSKTTVSDLEEMIKKGGQVTETAPLKQWSRSGLAIWTRLISQWLFVFPLTRLFVKLKIEGRENIEELTLPAIFMPNHISYLDSLVLVRALPFRIRKRIAFAAAKDMMYERYKSTAWLSEFLFNHFPFPRQEHENIRTGLDYMGRMLDRNFSVIVYPEGKMSISGKLQPLKHGAGLIAVEMDSLIVPVKIEGTNIILPAGEIVPRRRGKIKVTFGKPIKFDRRDSYREATDEIDQALRGMGNS